MDDRNNQTTIIYLIGKPGTGKYTISQELAKLGYIICDNQLANNPIFTLLNYDGFTRIPDFAWDAIKKIRDSIFDFITVETDNSYVLTNALYENEGDHKLYKQVEQVASKRRSLFVPVKLIISEEENLKRITEPSRRMRWKSIDPKYVYAKEPLLNIKHPHLFELDVSTFSAKEAAVKVLEHATRLQN